MPFTSRKTLPAALLAAATLLAASQAQAAVEFWRTDGTTGGTWTSTFWNIGSANATGGTGWTSGNDANFTANSTLTFATSTVGNVTVADGVTVTVTSGGTLTLGGVRTFDIGTGSTLNWTSQSQSTAAGNEGAGVIKNGTGVLNWGAGPGTNARYDGGFTLNAGTVIVSSTNSFGTAVLTVNGGTIQASGTTTYNGSSMVIGGDFGFTGTGNQIYQMPISIGGTTRTITDNITSGSRTLSGVVTGTGAAGLVIAGTGAAPVVLSNTANNFAGGVAINGSTLSISDPGNIGSGNITFGGGILQVTGATLTTVDSRIANPSTFNGGFDVDSANPTFTVGLALGGSGSITKNGTGTLQLTNTNTYSGTTTINKGTLQLGSSASIATSQKITVGTSSFTATTLDASALPGLTIATQTLAGNNGSILGNTTLSATSSFLEDFAVDTAAAPAVKITGNLTLNPGAAFTFNGPPDGVSNYVLATYSGNETGTFTGAAPAGYTFDYGTGANSQIMLVAAPVPEPASLSLLAIGAAALLTRRRK